jgi:hypothetical protein
MNHNVRNMIAVLAYNRKGGMHARSLNEPRKGQRNMQREYLEEYECEIADEHLLNEDCNDCYD